MSGAGRWGGMEFVPGALGKLSGGNVSGGSGRREPTPPSRATASFRGDSHATALPISHGRSGSDSLDTRGVPSRPTGTTMSGGRPLSGGSRSGSRGDVNLSTSPNPTQFQAYPQETFDGANSAPQTQGSVPTVVSGGGGGGGDYIQRCVIIQRGEKGYGLTVSGDNPVFVQDVKPHGAAARAGVQPGDRIMKVNGTLVTSSNHVEVVRMIKSGSLVSLTLLGRPPGSGGGGSHRPRPTEVNQPNNVHHPMNESSGPKGIDGDVAWAKVKSLQKYLDDALADRENLASEYKKHPNDRSYGKILENNRLIEQLHAQVQDACRKAGIPLPPSSSSDENAPPLPAPKLPYPQDGGVPNSSIAYPSSHDEHSTPLHDLFGMTEVDSGGGTQSPTSSPVAQALTFGPTQYSVDDVDTGFQEALFNIPENPQTPSENFYPSSPDSRLFAPSASGNASDVSPVSPGVAPFPTGLPPTAPPFPGLSLDALTNPTSAFGTPGFPTVGDESGTPIIMPFEDDDLSEDIANNEAGPFSDFGKLKQNPAHLAVFLRYLVDNSDPSCLFFFLITESYASSSSSIKDLKRWAYEISSTFLFEGSPLALNIDELEGYVKHVNEILESKIEKEADLRNIFDTIRKHAKEKIIDTLSEFRHNRQIGMGGFYGDHLLKESDGGKLKEPAKQLRIVESLLLKFLKDWTDNFGEWEESTDRNQALAFCLVTFFKLYGLEKVSKSTGDLEKIPVFISKQNNRGIRGLTGGGPGAKGEKIHGHSLQPSHYTKKTECVQCSSLLWGIGTLQGYHCKNCIANFHKSCLNSIENDCPSIQKKGFFPALGPKRPKKTEPKDEKEKEPRRSTSPSQQPKELSPAIEGGADTTPDGGDGSSNTAVTRSNSMKDNTVKDKSGHTGKKPQRSKSDPKVDPEDLKHILNNQGPHSSHTSASQSSLESSGSAAVPDSDHESGSVKTTIPEAPPLPGTPIVSDPIPGDSEFLHGDELPRLEEIIDLEQLQKMNKKEKEKQKVINELFHTELTHVRHLRVLEAVFFVPMRNEHIMSKDDLDNLFPNLSEVINVHTDLQQAMKIRREEVVGGPVHRVSDILLERFQGEKGEKFRETCANFLKNQGHALDMLREKTKKDPKLGKFLQEKEEDQRCRRLQFKDLLPEEMQRIVKYPILLESLIKHLDKESDEYKGILEAIKLSKGILTFVNIATRDCQNKHMLHDIMKRLDTSPWDRSNHPLVPDYKNLDLTQQGDLIFETDLVWRQKKKEHIFARVLLFQEFILLLTRMNAGPSSQQRQDEKYVLKCHGTATQIEAPIIRLKHMLFREVATEKKAFFLITNETDRKSDGDNKSGTFSTLYEFEARTLDQRKKWQEHIDSAVKEAGGTSDAQRFYPFGTSGAPTVVQTNLTKTSAGVTIIKPPSPDDEPQVSAHESQAPRRDGNGGSLGSLSTSTLTGGDGGTVGDSASQSGAHGSVDDTLDSLTTPLTPVGMGDLVQPTEVTVQKINASSAIVSKTGEALSSPHEQLKSKDAQIRKLLSEKQRILAGILRLPAASDLISVAEAAAVNVSEDGHRKPKNSSDMVLAAWHQVEQLTHLTLDYQTPVSASASTAFEDPPLQPHRRESAETTTTREAKTASLGRNAYLQEPTQRNRHTSSPAVSTSCTSPLLTPDENDEHSLARRLSNEPSVIPTSKLVPLVLSLRENLSSLLSVMEISPSSYPADNSHYRLVRADSIPPYPPPPPPGIPSDETSASSTSRTPPVAPPTPFAGGYRGSSKVKKRNPTAGDEGSGKEEEEEEEEEELSNPSCESSTPSPIPICPPPPKDLLLPTSTSSSGKKAIVDDDDEEEEDVILADELGVDYADADFSPDHSASSTPLPPPRAHGRGGCRSPLNPALSPPPMSPPQKSLSPGRTARSSLSPARSSPKPSSPLPQRHPVSNNHLVMEEGEESLIDDDVYDDSHHVNSSATSAAAVATEGSLEPEKPRKTRKKKKKNNSSNDASVSSGTSTSSATLEGGVPFPTPRLEDEDDDDFESNTTYV